MSCNEWKEYKLKDICTKIGSGSTPRGGANVYKKEGITLIRSQNVYNNSFDYSGLVFIDDEAAKKLKNVELKENDILLNITGDSVARCTMVPQRLLPARVNQHVCILRANNKIIHPFYLKSFLVNSKMQEIMLSLAQSGGTRAALTKGMIENFEIPIPPLEEQEKIANILSPLDKKIELNNEMNRTLEEIAQALFKRWFVDFEFPNENGEPYKSSGGEMVESELGMIPKEWEVGQFRDYTENVLGGDWGKESEQGNYTKEVFCLRGADIPEIRLGNKGSLPKRYILEKNHKNKKLNSGDIVIEISGGSPTQSTGRVTYINDLMLKKFDSDLVCTNFCRAITLKSPIYMEYFYFYWKFLYDNDVFFQYENGTTGIKNLDINRFLDKYKIVIPPESLIILFSKNIGALMNKIQFNGEENIYLTNIRNTLLPKLMSGEIRVK